MKAGIVTRWQMDLSRAGLWNVHELGTQRAFQSLGEGTHATGSVSFSQKLLQIEKQSPREGKFPSTPCVCLGRRVSVQSKLLGQCSNAMTA